MAKGSESSKEGWRLAAGDVPLDVWRELYRLAGEIRRLAPWDWMCETEVFGVRDTGSEEVVFTSVMGQMGDYHAMALYPGEKELSAFWRLEEDPREDAAESLFDICQIHVAFGRKGELMPQEKALIAHLDLEFKGAHAWPQFRSFRPGYFPWTPDAREARLLDLAMRQLLDVAPRARDDRDLLLSRIRGERGATLLVRVPRREGESWAWGDERMPFMPSDLELSISIPGEILSALEACRESASVVEADVFPLIARIGKRGERPRMSHLLLLVDGVSGAVVGMETMTVDEDIDRMREETPSKVFGRLASTGRRPRAIVVSKPWLSLALAESCDRIGIQLFHGKRLPALEEARDFLVRSLE